MIGPRATRAIAREVYDEILRRGPLTSCEMTMHCWSYRRLSKPEQRMVRDELRATPGIHTYRTPRGALRFAWTKQS